jgi:DnaK suppressor protein
VTPVEPRPSWMTPATDPVEPSDGSVRAADTADTPEPEPRPDPDGRPVVDLDAVTADLAAVEAALERLDQGSYGRCGACDSAIDDDVLAADPTATTCAAHLPV